MKRSWPIAIAFIFCMAAAAVAMTWVTLAVLSLERTEASGRRQAALEENVRLALWRADSTLAPLVMQESLMPSSAYRPADAARFSGGTLSNSSLAAGPPPLPAATPCVLVRFQFEADGRLVSPDVPRVADRKPGGAGSDSGDHAAEAEKQLASVAAVATPARLRPLLPQPPAAPPPSNIATMNQLAISPQQRAADRDRRSQMRQNFSQQGEVEFNLRNGVWNSDFSGNSALIANNQNGDFANRTNFNAVSTMNLPGVPLMPLWLDGRLLLARRISIAGQEVIQGCLLDWPAIRDLLVDTVGDLLPTATFEPVANGAAADPARMLAALPVRIVPGELPPGEPPPLSPIRLSLVVAWGCMLLTAAAVTGLLTGILRLSNRRASFVTAVTHELRTPLTTFQMYVEMLAEGMVPPGEPSRQYLKTLRAEVTRLTHMVENILAYARLERGRNIGRVETIALGQLLDGIQPRLAQRAEQAGMELVVDGLHVAAKGDSPIFADTKNGTVPADRGCLVMASASAVDQILFNLVDNACKYAAQAEDKRIHLEVQLLEDRVALRVRDHGPGMPPPRRLFRSFGKSAQDAAQSAPGIGLGLALSRRLARHIGGDLQVVSSADQGACLALRLARSH